MKMTVPHRHNLCTFVFALSLLGMASSAMALDGYKDRTGTYVGAGIGGAVGTAQISTPITQTGLEDGEMGLQLRAVTGSGITESLGLELQLHYWVTAAKGDTRPLDHHHLAALAAGRYFVWEGLFLTGSAGLAVGLFDTQVGTALLEENKEMGLAVGAGAGVDLFVTGRTAVSGEIGYAAHLYGETQLHAAMGLITFRWH